MQKARPVFKFSDEALKISEKNNSIRTVDTCISYDTEQRPRAIFYRCKLDAFGLKMGDDSIAQDVCVDKPVYSLMFPSLTQSIKRDGQHTKDKSCSLSHPPIQSFALCKP